MHRGETSPDLRPWWRAGAPWDPGTDDELLSSVAHRWHSWPRQEFVVQVGTAIGSAPAAGVPSARESASW